MPFERSNCYGGRQSHPRAEAPVKGVTVIDSHKTTDTERTLQPLLHELATCVHAPSLVLSAPDGQIHREGVQGWFCRDRRLLAGLTVAVSGHPPEGLAAHSVDAARAVFTGAVRHLGDLIADPTVTIERRRTVHADRLVEFVVVTSVAQQPVDVTLQVTATCDLASMDSVKTGQAGSAVPATAVGDGLEWRGDAAPDERPEVSLGSTPAPDAIDGETLSWRARLQTGESLEVALTAAAAEQPDAEFVEAGRRPWAPLEVRSADPRLPAVVDRGLLDLEGLLLRDAGSLEGDLFAAAGSPWFLTLFGRDSLWVARMTLALGTDLALGTLRTLARRQGVREDPRTEEQPGKILHEVRRAELQQGSLTLPPLYYGTVDATPLWVVLLAEAWRWGADPAAVEDLLPAAERCLSWQRDQAPDGFLRYIDRTGHGLANQGWKDSGDSIQWADGRLAEPPIALSEVQGYAYQAAVAGADLLDAFGRPGADAWRSWAEQLRARFRARFWVSDEVGPYPAVALDREGHAVDSVASNMGHLLGTGILDADEAALVARRLTSPDMSSGFGLRTLTRRSPRFSRLSYHGGTVWPHDTAIAVMGLAREGHTAAAAQLLSGLVEAAPAFDFRMPELYGGDARTDAPRPLPYPAACRPQAWSAAGVVAGLTSLLGLRPDVPAGSVAVGVSAEPFTSLRLDGLCVADRPARVEVAADGAVTLSTDAPVRVG